MAPFLHPAVAGGEDSDRRKETLVRRAIFGLVVGAAVLGTASAQAGGLDLRIGGFFPSANSNLFDDVTSLYTRGAPFGTATPPGVEKSDWDGLFGGIEFNSKIVNNLEWAVSFDGYGKSIDTSYRNYVRPDDTPIQQTLRLTTVPMGLSLRLVPTSRRARIAPFVSVGVDLVYYKYEEFGDFIDFFAPDNPIIPDSFEDAGVAFGFHAGGGVRIGLSDDVSIVGEARYLWSKSDMGEDFEAGGNEIDLGGLGATIGVHIRF
jgi:opacity protein-like surface antigen